MDNIFGSGSDLTWYQEGARTLLIFAYGLLLVRIAGRRLFGKWSALDSIVSIMIGSNLSRALTGNAGLWGTLAATTFLVALHSVLAQAVARWPTASRIIEGRPIELVRSGAADAAMFNRHSISKADLNEALRQSGIQNVSDTKAVTLEPSGKITVLK